MEVLTQTNSTLLKLLNYQLEFEYKTLTNPGLSFLGGEVVSIGSCTGGWECVLYRVVGVCAGCGGVVQIILSFFSLLYSTPAPSAEHQHPEAWPASTFEHI